MHCNILLCLAGVCAKIFNLETETLSSTRLLHGRGNHIIIIIIVATREINSSRIDRTVYGEV